MKVYFRKYSKEQLIEAIKRSRSLHQALIALGVSSKTSNWAAIRKRIQAFDIDTSHFTKSGEAYKRGRQTPLDDYFSNKVKIRSHHLRVRLLSDGIFDSRCSRCSLKEWQGQSVPLELNHINGDHFDNALENLEMLCPNCHALTPHWKGRGNKGKTREYCKRGHLRSPENLYSHGGCKACKRDYDRGLRTRQKLGNS